MYKQEKVLLGGASGLGLSVTGAACYKQWQQPEPQPRHGAEMPVLGWSQIQQLWGLGERGTR